MSDLGDLAKILYKDFFMRDLLGKVGPGLVATTAVVKTFNIDFNELLSGTGLTWLFWVAALPAFYMVGLALQILAEFIGLHSASPKPRYLCVFKLPKKWKQANIDFDNRLEIIANAKKWGDVAKTQRERFVYLKEASGNFAIALFVVITCLLLPDYITKNKYTIIIILGILSITLLASHFLHAFRQANFEIKVLEKQGEISNNEAKKMRSVICLKKSDQ